MSEQQIGPRRRWAVVHNATNTLTSFLSGLPLPVILVYSDAIPAYRTQTPAACPYPLLAPSSLCSEALTPNLTLEP